MGKKRNTEEKGKREKGKEREKDVYMIGLSANE